MGFESAVATSSVNEVATVFLFRIVLHLHFGSFRSFSPDPGSGLRPSRRRVFTLKPSVDGLVWALSRDFVEVEAAPAVCCCGFIGLDLPRRQIEHCAVYPPTKKSALRIIARW